MEIVHRICFNTGRDADAVTRLRAIGMLWHEVSDGAGSALAWFEISEAAPRWPEVNRIVTRFNLPFIAEKRFTKDEVRSSKWVAVRADYMWGYPMPKDDMGFNSLSFDPSSECQQCGAGRTQKAPLRLEGEPRLRGRAFMGIFWILDICARPDVVSCMQEQGLSGFEAASILKHKSGAPLHTVSQLRFTHEIAHGLIDTNLERESPRCGHVKYLGASREVYRFHADALNGCPDFVHTAQWFGSGHLAVNLILASAAFANLYLDKSWKGLRLEPVELVP